MTSTPKPLKFAVKFATMDLDEARPGDWLNLRDDLANFVGAAAAVEVRPGNRIATIEGEAEDQTIRDLQTTTLQLLEYLADRKTIGVYPAHIPLPSIQKTVIYVAGGTGGGVFFDVRGTLPDLFLDALMNDLAQPGSLMPVLRCPECGRLFYRNRKQKYCDRPCVAKANWRDYMKTPEGKKTKSRSDKKRREARRGNR